MKKKILYLMFSLFSSFMIINKVSAYVIVDYSDGSLNSFQPAASSYISYDVLSNAWGTGGTKLSLASNPILMSFNQYWYAGAVSGNHLSVHADYYVGFYSPGTYNSFFTNSRNILTSNNLRCAVGNYKEGYSSSYGSPQISNFSVTFDKAIPPGGADGYNYLYHITFDYYQQINTINSNSANMSCWFEVNPSNALVGQIVYGIDVYSYFWYRNVSLKYSVSTDPNTEILGDISSSIDKTNDKLDDLNNNITDDNVSGASDSASGFFNDFEDNDYGLSDIITIPLSTIKTITNNSCTVLTLNIPFVNKTLTLPCMTTIYEEYFGNFLTIYQTISFGIISYWICVQIYAMVKGFKNPDKDEIEVLDL